MYDFAVIGLGPAGATAARLLAPGFSILALDKKPASRTEWGGDFSKPCDNFSKPCGGLLAPDAQRAIALLGLTLPAKILVDPQIFSVKTVDLQSGLSRHYLRSYLNMDRDKFDRWLISLIPGKVSLVPGAVYHGAETVKGGFRLRYKAGGAEHTAEARFILGADGAASAVRRQFFPAVKFRTYTAIQEWFSADKTAPFYSCIFDASLTDSYAWGISKNNTFILGGAFPPKRAKAAFEELKQKLSGGAFGAGQPLAGKTVLTLPTLRSLGTEACQVIRPRPFRFCTALPGPEGGGLFLLGEAAGFVSPSSLEGISYALESGRRLAALFVRGIPDRPWAAYNRTVRSIKLKLFIKNLKSPFMYQSFLRRLVMKSGVTAIRVEQ